MPRYGTFKYGAAKYGGVQLPFDFHVLLKNPAEKIVEILRKDIESLSWSFASQGGCRQCSLTLKRDLSNYGLIGPEYILEVYIVPEKGSRRTLVWSGFVDPVSPVLSQRSVTLGAKGLSAWMAKIIVPNVTYLNQTDVADIVKNVVDTYVVPGSRIKRTAALGLVGSTGVDVENETFDTNALDVIQTMATIGGNADWGVRADREFYFLPRVTSVTHSFCEGALPARDQSSTEPLLTEFVPEITARDRINWLYLKAGDGVTYRIENDAFMPNNQAEANFFAPSVKSAADAQLLGASILSRANGLTLEITERFPGLTAGMVNSLTPNQDYVSGSFSVDWPEAYVKDADDTEPTVEQHYSVQGDGRVLVFMGSGDGFLLAKYNVKTGGHLAKATIEGIRTPFEVKALPMGAIEFYTQRWRGYRLMLNSVTYVVTENGLRAELDLGEVRTAVADLLEGFQKRLSDLRQGIA